MKPLRWASYFMCHGERFPAFWADLAGSANRRAMLIWGGGFDPRALSGVEVMRRAGLPIVECRSIDFQEGTESSSRQYAAQTASNRAGLANLLPGVCIESIPIDLRTRSGRTVGGRRVSDAFRDPSMYKDYTDVVVDITALPRGLYFPLIGTLLELWLRSPAEDRVTGNLHVVVCENPGIDQRIVEEGGDKAEWVHGFAGGLPRASIGDAPRIWAPVLGEGQATRLKKIEEFTNPREICPVLPFPATNPRRADDLVVEYRELLFDTWKVEPRDFLYVAEHNPFDVYRQLCGLAERYEVALRHLGGAKTVVSAHSSKLLSLGVLLAAFERELAVPFVQPTGYVVREGLENVTTSGELFEVWLAGEAYEPC